MSVFIDASALFAVLDRDDEQRVVALERWREMVDRDEALFCSNYVLVETYALVQRGSAWTPSARSIATSCHSSKRSGSITKCTASPPVHCSPPAGGI